MHNRNVIRTGFTVAELLLAMTITVLIGASVAGMVYAVSYGTSSQKDLQSVLVANDVVGSRLGAYLRSSKMVLAQGSGYLVLWKGDTDADNKPKVSELVRIEYGQAAKTITLYKAPPGLAPGSDAAYVLDTTDFDAVTSALKGTSSFPATPLASNVTALAFVLNKPQVKQCNFVGYRITTTINATAGTAVAGMTLRNH